MADQDGEMRKEFERLKVLLLNNPNEANYPFGKEPHALIDKLADNAKDAGFIQLHSEIQEWYDYYINNPVYPSENWLTGKYLIEEDDISPEQLIAWMKDGLHAYTPQKELVLAEERRDYHCLRKIVENEDGSCTHGVIIFDDEKKPKLPHGCAAFPFAAPDKEKDPEGWAEWLVRLKEFRFNEGNIEWRKEQIAKEEQPRRLSGPPSQEEVEAHEAQLRKRNGQGGFQEVPGRLLGKEPNSTAKALRSAGYPDEVVAYILREHIPGRGRGGKTSWADVGRTLLGHNHQDRKTYEDFAQELFNRAPVIIVTKPV